MVDYRIQDSYRSLYLYFIFINSDRILKNIETNGKYCACTVPYFIGRCLLQRTQWYLFQTKDAYFENHFLIIETRHQK